MTQSHVNKIRQISLKKITNQMKGGEVTTCPALHTGKE